MVVAVWLLALHETNVSLCGAGVRCDPAAATATKGFKEAVHLARAYRVWIGSCAACVPNDSIWTRQHSKCRWRNLGSLWAMDSGGLVVLSACTAGSSRMDCLGGFGGLCFYDSCPTGLAPPIGRHHALIHVVWLWVRILFVYCAERKQAQPPDPL